MLLDSLQYLYMNKQDYLKLYPYIKAILKIPVPMIEVFVYIHPFTPLDKKNRVED